jgi:4'-phosphopantetheinyl transferase
VTEAIEAGEVHVWYVLTDEVAQPELLAAYERLLQGEELARHRRLMIDRVRHEHLLTRALARTCLSRYADVPPEAWTFEMNRWGRPEIAAPEEARWLRFNLSNTHGLVACAVARDLEIGVDAEYVERKTTPVEIADRFFSAEEVAALHRIEGEHAQRERFFEYWTLKESYIKARGMGLAIPLGDFSFHLDDGPDAVRISFAPSLDDDPSSWSFWRARPTPLHRIATAVRCGAAMAPRVSLRRVVPLVG